MAEQGRRRQAEVPTLLGRRLGGAAALRGFESPSLRLPSSLPRSWDRHGIPVSELEGGEGWAGGGVGVRLRLPRSEQGPPTPRAPGRTRPPPPLPSPSPGGQAASGAGSAAAPSPSPGRRGGTRELSRTPHGTRSVSPAGPGGSQRPGDSVGSSFWGSRPSLLRNDLNPHSEARIQLASHALPRILPGRASPARGTCETLTARGRETPHQLAGLTGPFQRARTRRQLRSASRDASRARGGTPRSSPARGGRLPSRAR